jgi:hypothetical protein
MERDDNYCLVLCYAKWCGHCTSYYIKKENGEEEKLEKKEIEHIKKLKDGAKLPEVKTWQEVRLYVDKVLKCNVTQFEDEADFQSSENKTEEGEFRNQFNLENMKPKGWPTIMMCKRENENEQYKRFRIFEENRTSLADIKKFVEDCIEGKPEEKSEEESAKQTGGSNNYRMKYKKYKLLYSELVDKYNTLKHKTN